MRGKLFFLTAVFSFVCAFSFGQTFYVTSSGDDNNDGSNNTDQALATIQKAHDLAVDGNTIDVGAGTYTETVVITKNLTIIGDNANNTFVEASASVPDKTGTGSSAALRTFDLGNSRNLSLKNLTIRNGNTSQGGGGVFVRASCTLTTENCIFSDNYSNWGGAAVFSYGDINLTKSTFEDNTATASGGAVNSSGTTILIENSTFNNNHATVKGGAIYVNQCHSTTIKKSSFDSNSSGSDGGAIGAIGESGFVRTFEMENCTLYQNNAEGTGKGGALYFYDEMNYSLNNNTLALNTTGGDGRKGVYSGGASVATAVTNNIFYNAASGGTEFGFDGVNPLASTTVKNNIFRQVWLSELTSEPNSIVGSANVTEANVFGTIVYADNGGEVKTIAINSGSIAENAADPGTATIADARTYGANGTRDIGAYEIDGTLSAASNTTLTGVSIAPNPSNGTVHIYNLDTDTYELSVYGLNGAVLYNATQANSTIQLPANIKGLVFIKINTGSSTKVFKHLVK